MPQYEEENTEPQGWQPDSLTGGCFRWVRSFRLYVFPMASCWYWGISNIVGDVCDSSDQGKVFAEGALSGLILGCVSDLLRNNSHPFVPLALRDKMKDLEEQIAR